MNAGEHDQDFEKLQRLLKLKRHEKPHPRYFNDFSSQVTARIRAGESGGKHEADASAAPLWLQRLWRSLEAKPATSGIFAAAVCGLVLVGIMMDGKQAGGPSAPPTFVNAPQPPTANAIIPEQSPEVFGQPSLANATLANSTNPSALTPALPGSLFSAPALQTLPASGQPISPR